MLKLFSTLARGRAGARRPGEADPFADHDVARMDLRMLADLPPEQLHERTAPPAPGPLRISRAARPRASAGR